MTNLIIDPDDLTRTQVVITTGDKKIELVKGGLLGDEGVTLQCLYSFLKEEWKSDNDLIKFPFPITAITEEKFELFNGWDFKNAGTRNLIRIGGWALKDSGGVSQEEYAGIITLGVIGGSDQVYYQQETDGSATDIVLTGVVNQAVKIYGDVTHGDIDYRDYFKIFVREYAKTYGMAQLSDIGVSLMTYQVYRFPLTNGTDLKIIATDAVVDAQEPYLSMLITWFTSPQQRQIGATNYDFHVIIDGNAGTTEQIYTFFQRQLRKNTDIDAGSGNKIGKVTKGVLNFIGDSLYTLLYTTGEGTYIDDHQEIDRTRLYFTDDTGAVLQFPYAAILSLQFGDNLKADAEAMFWAFFTNDDAGTDEGRDYGTATAILVDTTSAVATIHRARTSNIATIGTVSVHGLAIGNGIKISGVGGTGYNGNAIVLTVPDTTHFTYANTGDNETETADTGGIITRTMVGKISGASSVQFSYAYDTNIQRGSGSEGEDAPITVVAIGLETAQFVVATGTILRSLANVVSLVAALERNYNNP